MLNGVLLSAVFSLLIANWWFLSCLACANLAPCFFTYFTVLFISVILPLDILPAPPDPPIPRSVRRARDRWKQKQQRKTHQRFPSYRGLVHRSFPLRLRIARFYPNVTYKQRKKINEALAAIARVKQTAKLQKERQAKAHEWKLRNKLRKSMADFLVANCPNFTFRNPNFQTKNKTDNITPEQHPEPQVDCFDPAGKKSSRSSWFRPPPLRVGVRRARRLFALMATRPDHLLKATFHLLYGHLSEKNEHGVEVVYDTGASGHVLTDIRLFDEPPKPLAGSKELGGIGSGVPIIGEGTFTLKTLGVDGKFSYFRGKAYYAPKCSKSLICGQMLAQDAQKTYAGSDWLEELTQRGDEPESKINHERYILRNLAPNMSDIYVPLDPVCNLPLGLVYPASDHRDEFFPEVLQAHLCSLDHSNRNLSVFQKELLRWHARLGHPSMGDVFSMLRHRVLRPSKAGIQIPTGEVDLPKCSSCAYGKQCRRPKPGTNTTADPSKKKASVSDRLFPGQRVFTDHFYSSTPGRLESGYGKSSDTYCGGTIWVDGATGFTKVYMQTSMDTHSTLLSKKKFKREMADHNVPYVQEYVCDGAKSYNSKEFDYKLKENKQIQRLAAPGAHHHNGIAERAIGVTMSFARTQLIHAAMRWPEALDVGLWPMSVTHSAHLHNILPKLSRGNLAPLQLLLNAPLDPKRFDDLHVWGSPVFVLEPSLRDGKKLPRWRPRSRRGIYLGVSERYAASAPLCLNLTTGSITPQFHCLFDDWFWTVTSDDASDLSDIQWDEILETRYVWPESTADNGEPLDENPAWIDTWMSHRLERHPSALRNLPSSQSPSPQRESSGFEPNLDSAQLPAPSWTVENMPIESHEPFLVPDNKEIEPIDAETAQEASENEREEVTEQREVRFAPEVQTEEIPESPPPQRETPSATSPSSSRVLRDRSKLRRPARYDDTVAHLSSILPGLATKELIEEMLQWNDNLDHEHVLSNVLAMLAKKTRSPDLPNYKEAMSGPASRHYQKAMGTEWDELDDHETFDLVAKSEARANNEPITPCTWSFKCKRNQFTGEVKRYKARLCLRGDLEFVDEEVYAPVGNWATIRTLFILALVLDLETICIDFQNAFVQAKLDKPKYMSIPYGVEHLPNLKRKLPPGLALSDCCVRLHKSLYGSRLAPKMFYELCKHIMVDKLKMTVHPNDPCLFFGDGIVVVCYVDDQLIVGKSKEKIAKYLKLLEEFKLQFTKEEELATYLGITVQRDSAKGTIELKQTLLIEKLCNLVGLDMTKPRKKTSPPALNGQALGSHKDDDDFDQSEFSYSSAIGVLLYLANNTRPDIAFSVSQAARYSAKPKKAHATAVKRIARYLLDTKGNGLIMQPARAHAGEQINNLAVDCYVDADFAGTWNSEHATDPACVKSRAGYVICVGGCPITWTSKLIPEICVSTMMAEYVALSMSMRDLIFLREIVADTAKHLGYRKLVEVRTHSVIFEDNNGALALATCSHDTPHSKHYAVKYHWFREHVLKHKTCIVKKIATGDQLGDIFTKCDHASFATIRRKLMGW